MPELLVELLSEEIPARMQARAAENLKRLVCDGLKAAGLTFTKADAFATPRRLALVVDGIPLKQPDLTEESEVKGKGLRVDSPDEAKHGFFGALGLGLNQRDKAISALDRVPIGEWHSVQVIHSPHHVVQVGIRKATLKKGLYYVFKTCRTGRPTSDVLADLLPLAISNLSWPKTMRWADKPIRWIRPLNNVVAIFNRRVLRGAVFGLPFRMTTLGHSFMAPRPLTIRSFSDYKNRLFRAKVILDPVERRKRIQADAERLAKKAGLKLKHDVELLDEVAGLVEWPVCKLGAIDKSFMELPPELLTTVMRHHQKYFALTDGKGQLAPRFVVVLNTETRDGGKAAVAGNERVLSARLADARFFWDQDRKRNLESRVGDLKDRVFHAKLGSIYQKVERLELLAPALTDYVEGAFKDKVRLAARIAKADLSTGMVGEFPELQGIIGRYYALNDGISPEVANAVAEHYSPLGPNDDCPSKPVSVAVALADRIDTLIGFWAIDEKPTGSKDPYALRRAALGTIRLILENNLRIALVSVFNRSFNIYNETQKSNYTFVLSDSVRISPDLLAFFADRLKIHLRDKGVRHDLIDAVFAVKKLDGGKEDDLVRLLARVDALNKFLKSDDGVNLLTAYRRAANIVRDEKSKSETRFDVFVNQSLFRQREESFLYASLLAGGDQIQKALDSESYMVAMEFFANLRSPIDAFFDRVTVNAPEPELRENRLNLLAQITATMNRLADFSKLEGGER